MSQTTPQRSRFGDKLRRELDARGISIRALARTMSPDSPEVMRRNLGRWIGGHNQPSRVHRIAIAEALGVPLETFTDDDEEDDPVVALMAAIRRVVRDELSEAKRRDGVIA